MSKVCIIGGGAGGLAAAITAAEQGASVTIYEKANRVGKKLLRTGNGRCNLSNLHISPAGYNQPDFVAPILEQIDCNALRDWFQALGLATIEDGEGRIYPRSDTASSVLDVLRLRCQALGVQEICSNEITDIHALDADKIIFACGGGETLTRHIGLKAVAYSPILCPLKTNTDKIKGLSGLRAKAKVTLLREGQEIYSENGEVLFRDYGLSGIVILNMSRYAQKGDVLCLNFLPEYDFPQIVDLLQAQPYPDENILTGLFHRRLAEAFYTSAGSLSPKALTKTITDFRLTVEGPADTQNAQVTRGGLDIKQFCPNTLECKTLPGLYAIGEALDIDGLCGGYNLHWAFASGITAGRNAGK